MDLLLTERSATSKNIIMNDDASNESRSRREKHERKRKERIDLSKIQAVEENIAVESSSQSEKPIEKEHKHRHKHHRHHREEPEQVVSADDPIEKRKRIMEISRYLKTFDSSKYSELLRPFRRLDLESLTITELDNQIREIKFTLGCRSTVGAGTRGVLNTIEICEQILCTYSADYGYPVRVQGMTDALRADEDVVDDIKLMCLNNIS